MLNPRRVPLPLRPTAAGVLPRETAAELESLAAHPRAQLSAMRAFVADPGLRAWTHAAIERILNDRAHLAEIAQQSFAHPNGFDSIPLENRHPRYRVRLHVWWPEADLVTEDVHNHAWDFASRVLSGALIFTTYRIADDGVAHWHYPWRLGGTFAYDSHTVTTVNLSEVLNAYLAENTHYTFDRHELHRVAPIKTGTPVSTLVIVGAWQRDGSDVYTEKPRHGEGYRPLKDPYSTDQLAHRLRRYLECL